MLSDCLHDERSAHVNSYVRKGGTRPAESELKTKNKVIGPDPQRMSPFTLESTNHDMERRLFLIASPFLDECL